MKPTQRRPGVTCPSKPGKAKTSAVAQANPFGLITLMGMAILPDLVKPEPLLLVVRERERRHRRINLIGVVRRDNGPIDSGHLPHSDVPRPIGLEQIGNRPCGQGFGLHAIDLLVGMTDDGNRLNTSTESKLDWLMTISQFLTYEMRRDKQVTDPSSRSQPRASRNNKHSLAPRSRPVQRHYGLQNQV